MRLLREGRHHVERIMRERMQRLDRQFLRSFIPSRFPSLPQLQYIDLFLNTWERRLIGGAGFIAAIALLGIFWSIWKINTVPIPTTGGELQEVLVGNPRYVNPLFAATDTDRTLTNIVFLPLCDSFNRGIPTIASSCEISEKRAVVTIDKDRAWHDGESIELDDVIFTLESLQNPATLSPWHELAKRFTMGTDTEGRLILNAKQGTPEITTLLSLGVIPKHIWKDVEPAKMRTSGLNGKPVGSGAYSLDQVFADSDGVIQSVTLAAYDSFKPHRAYIDKINFRTAEDEAGARELFRMRQVDAMFLYNPIGTEELVKRDVRRYEISSPTVVSLFFNPSHNALFRKREMRDAFVRAIDRPQIIKQALGGNAIPTRAPFPINVVREPVAIQPDTSGTEAAALFKKAIGETASTTLVLGVPAHPAYEAVAEEIKKQLAPYNIAVTPTLIYSLDEGSNLMSYDMLLLGQDYGMTGNAFPFWHSTASGAQGANYARYQIREVDGWLEQLLTETRPEQRGQLFSKLTARLVNDAPAVFLYQPTYQYYVSNKVTGVVVPEAGEPTERFQKSYEWSIMTSRSWK